MVFVKPAVRKSLLAKMLSEVLDTRVMIKHAMKGARSDKVSSVHCVNLERGQRTDRAVTDLAPERKTARSQAHGRELPPFTICLGLLQHADLPSERHLWLHECDLFWSYALYRDCRFDRPDWPRDTGKGESYLRVLHLWRT